mgnify:CR=1 FL=1
MTSRAEFKALAAQGCNIMLNGFGDAATIEAVKKGGGAVLNGPMDVPGGVRIANCMDPQGAAFSLHTRQR